VVAGEINDSTCLSCNSFRHLEPRLLATSWANSHDYYREDAWPDTGGCELACPVSSPFHDALGLAKLIYFGWAAASASTTKPVSLTLSALAEAIAALGGDQGQRAPSRENRKAQQFAPVLELRRNG
jgi:hypothetical protein